MPHTLELLSAALKKQKAAAWCRQLNITEAAMSTAKKRGRLSPTLAGNLALEMGADAVFWTAVAAAEAEPPGPLRERLERSLSRHKTAHYGQAHDDKTEPINPPTRWVFCCLNATREGGKRAVGICRRRRQCRQEGRQTQKGAPPR